MIEKSRKKEKHKRIAKEDIDLLGYDNLIMKVMAGLAYKNGLWVYDYKSALKQEAMVGLLKAYKAYDPTRGTFVTLAYLKIHTEMTRFLNRQSRYYVCMNNFEDIKFQPVFNKSPSMTWQELFPSNHIDYYEVAKLAIPEDDKVAWGIFQCLCDGVPWYSVHKKLGLTMSEAKEKREQLKEDMVAVVKELVGGPEYY